MGQYTYGPTTVAHPCFIGLFALMTVVRHPPRTLKGRKLKDETQVLSTHRLYLNPSGSAGAVSRHP